MSLRLLPPRSDDGKLPFWDPNAMRGLLLKDVQHLHHLSHLDGADHAIGLAIEVVLELEQTAEVAF